MASETTLLEIRSRDVEGENCDPRDGSEVLFLRPIRGSQISVARGRHPWVAE